MRLPAIAALFAFSLATAASAPSAAQMMRIKVRQTSVRVPVQPTSSPVQPVRWRESRGPKCLSRIQLAGAQLSEPGAVDLILRDRRRIRAQLEKRCMSLDLYRGFYVRPTSDGRVCADRDAIHARSGGECGIKRFRLLTPR